MVKFFSLIFLSSAFAGHALAQTPQKVVLTQRSTAELVLKNGAKAKEAVYKYDGQEADKADFNTSLFLSTYDWKTSLESGFEMDKTENLTTTDMKYERYRTKLALDKSFLTGTKITAAATRLSQKTTNLTPGNISSDPQEQTYDLFTLNLEQNLWRNGFGRADRAGLRAIEAAANSNQILKVSELQTVVLDAIRAFWKTYVAQENFRESVAARERYQKLVETIKRKNSVGYAKPGEYAQVQAELETRIQNAKKASLTYLSEMDALATLLNLPPSSEIELRISDELMAPPQLKIISAEDTRTVKAQKLTLESSEEKLTAAKSQSGLGVSLVGQLNSSGVDRSSNQAFSEMTGGSQPLYYTGVKLSYSFGSGNLDEQVKNKNMIRILNETKLERLRNEQQNALVQAERKVQSNYAVAQSFSKEREFRDRAARELTNTYNQGRIDITTYIDALNKFFTTKTNYIQAIGDYQVALNEWAAARDELIPEQNLTTEGN